MMLLSAACSKDESAPAPSASASAAPSPSASAPVASTSAAATASASAAPEPAHDCPPGSTGIGSFNKPCEAKGSARLMVAKWKKTDDKGPWFSVTNKSQLSITHGRVAVYFYDKAGKQLDVQDDSVPPKSKPYHTCAGNNLFAGPMKPGENAVLAFSCVPKSVIPDGAVTIEAELQMVGFPDATGKKVDFYWRNSDLTPDVRPKGGVK
jgi:hypothetical protein